MWESFKGCVFNRKVEIFSPLLYLLTLLHEEGPKLYGVLASLSEIGLIKAEFRNNLTISVHFWDENEKSDKESGIIVRTQITLLHYFLSR